MLPTHVQTSWPLTHVIPHGTQDELLQEMMRELGFQRRGKNVVTRLTAAIIRSVAS